MQDSWLHLLAHCMSKVGFQDTIDAITLEVSHKIFLDHDITGVRPKDNNIYYERLSQWYNMKTMHK